MAKILSIEQKIYAKQNIPTEQIPTITAPTRYHEDVEQRFHLERNETRFALGIAWVCNVCGEEATTIEAFAPEIGAFLLVKASCRQCGHYFLHPGCFRLVTEETASLHDDDLSRYWVILMKAWAHDAMSEEV